jgi:hypothetical protein
MPENSVSVSNVYQNHLVVAMLNFFSPPNVSCNTNVRNHQLRLSTIFYELSLRVPRYGECQLFLPRDSHAYQMNVSQDLKLLTQIRGHQTLLSV